MSTQTGIQPKQIKENVPSLTMAGLSETYLFNGPMDPSTQWQKLGTWLGNIPGQKGQVAYGVCFDLENGSGIEYLCGVEVTDDTDGSGLPDGFVVKQLPASTYAVFIHDGHVSEIRGTCDAIWKKWLPASNYKKPAEADFFFERYGERFDPGTGKGDIEIWIPVEA